MSKYSNLGSGVGTYSGSTSHKKVTKVDAASAYNYPKLMRNPFVQDADVRIPDGEVMIPTSTFDFTHDVDFTINASGYAALCVALTGKPSLLFGGTTLADSNINVKTAWNNPNNQIKLAAQKNAGLLFSATGKDFNDITVIPSESYWAGVDSKCRGWRLVAAGIECVFVGNDTNNNGVITGLHIPGGTQVQATRPSESNIDNYASASWDFTASGSAYDGETYIEMMSDWNGIGLEPIIPAGWTNTSLQAETRWTFSAPASIAQDTALWYKYPQLLEQHKSNYGLRNNLGAITRPLKDGLTLTYAPKGPTDFKFRRPHCGPTTERFGDKGIWWRLDTMKTGGAVTAAAFPDDSNSIGPFSKYTQVNETGNGCFLIHVTGASPGAAVKCKISMHYEAIPEGNLNYADNAKLALPSAAAVDRAAAAAATTTPPQPGSSSSGGSSSGGGRRRLRT